MTVVHEAEDIDALRAEARHWLSARLPPKAAVE
jgi:hypothetical protein